MKNECASCSKFVILLRRNAVILVISLLVIWLLAQFTVVALSESKIGGELQEWARVMMRNVDIAKIKLLWVGATIISTVPLTVNIQFPEPMASLIYGECRKSGRRSEIPPSLRVGCHP